MRIYFYTASLAILAALLMPPKSDSVETASKAFSSKTYLSKAYPSKAYPGSFAIHIVANKTLPIEAGQEFTLEANIVMENGGGDFEFQWLLPEGVQVIRGVVDPTLTFTNGSAQTKITLMILNSRYNYQIVGEAYRMNSQGVRGAVAQFNTHPQLLEKASRTPDHKKYRVIQ